MSILVSNPRVEEIRAQCTGVSESDPFPVIESQLMEWMPLKKLVLPEDQADAKRAIVAHYSASVDLLHRLDQDQTAVFREVTSNHVWRHYSDPQSHLREDLLKHVRKQAHYIPLSIKDSLFAEIMVNEAAIVREILLDALQQTVHQHLEDFRTTLTQLQSIHVVGQIEWLSKDVCRYHFFRRMRFDRKAGERTVTSSSVTVQQMDGYRIEHEWERQERVQDFERGDLLEKHIHQLYNSKRYQHPAKQVRKPKWADTFLAAMPGWLARHLFVVEGDMLREDIEQSHKKVSSWSTVTNITERMVDRVIIREGRLYSPAVTLGSFVLTGWSGKDL